MIQIHLKINWSLQHLFVVPHYHLGKVVSTTQFLKKKKAKNLYKECGITYDALEVVQSSI